MLSAHNTARDNLHS